MGAEQRCPTCGKALEANAPGGLCPECLIKVGLGSGVAPGADTATGATRRDFVPPPVEKLGPLFPQLEILELIGKGGMGAVYKARQRELDRIVALKILPPDVGQDAAFAERFTREARALAKLNHPGIVTIYDFGRADGLYFFLMEYVDGVSLQQLMHGGRVSAREALAIVPQICDALQFAHDQGIVHRDIKPGNILLDRRGRVKVADFGLAKIIGNQNEGEPSGGESAPASSALSDASKVMGTPQYMSPEQISAPGEVDHRADIYALGVVFYQMLTGELPGKPLQPPSKKVQIDVRLDEVVLRALEQKPELRYQQASVLKTQIETIASTPPPNVAAPAAAVAPPSNATPLSETAPGSSKPWVSFCVALAYSGAVFGLGANLSPGPVLGIFVVLICLTPLLALLLSQLATPQALRTGFKLVAWLGSVASLLVIWYAVQVLYAAIAKHGSTWGAHLDQTVPYALNSLIWLGAIALPVCTVRLWRAVKKPVMGSGASVPPAEPARKHSTGKSIAIGCGVLAAGWLGFLFLVAMAAGVWFAVTRTKVPPTFGPVIEQVNKPASDFPETTDLSTPESACAAWQRATARKDAQAVSRLSWVKIDPAEEEAWFRDEETRDREGLAVYLKALTESRIVEVQTWRGDLANVITFLPFPPGKGKNPYSARSFGRIGGQWKNLGEDRLPSLEAARANFEQKKAAIWEQLQSLQPAASGVAPVSPPIAAKPVPLHRVIELTLADVRSGKESLASLATGGTRPPDFTAVGGDDSAGRAWLRAHDIDLVYYARTDSGDSGVGAYDLRLAKVPNAQFDSMDADGLVKALSGVERTEGGLMSARDGLPVTYVFETRRGLGGVLQITGFTDNPRGVKIRYKLVLPQRDEGK